jgi:hypothetical protein
MRPASITYDVHAVVVFVLTSRAFLDSSHLSTSEVHGLQVIAHIDSSMHNSQVRWSPLLHDCFVKHLDRNDWQDKPLSLVVIHIAGFFSALYYSYSNNRSLDAYCESLLSSTCWMIDQRIVFRKHANVFTYCFARTKQDGSDYWNTWVYDYGLDRHCEYRYRCYCSIHHFFPSHWKNPKLQYWIHFLFELFTCNTSDEV